MISVVLQDGPFFAIRLYCLIIYDMYSYEIIFYTLKNALVVILQCYRLYAVLKARRKAKDKNGTNGAEDRNLMIDEQEDDNVPDSLSNRSKADNDHSKDDDVRDTTETYERRPSLDEMEYMKPTPMLYQPPNRARRYTCMPSSSTPYTVDRYDYSAYPYPILNTNGMTGNYNYYVGGLGNKFHYTSRY